MAESRPPLLELSNPSWKYCLRHRPFFSILGPLLFLPVLYLIYRLVTRPLAGLVLGSDVNRRGIGTAAFFLAVLLLAAVVAVTYFPGKFDFDRLCIQEGVPSILERARVQGVWLEPFTVNRAREFRNRGQFDFVEGRNAPGELARYFRTGDSTIEVVTVDAPQSRFAVRQTFETEKGGVLATRKVVYEHSTGRELARASSLVYEGGPLALLLGTWGMSSCPDPRTSAGSVHFQTFYDLEEMVLSRSTEK